MTNSINNEKQIPAIFFLAIVEFLEQQCGIECEIFLKQHNVNIQSLKSKQHSVGLGVLDGLIQYALLQSKSYEVLYALAKLSSPSRLGILGYLMVHSKNVKEALEKLCKYYVLIGKKIRPVFTKASKGYKIVIYFNDELGGLTDLKEYNVMIHLFAIVHLINYIIPERALPEYVGFVQNKSEFALKDGKIAGLDVRFAQEENALFFSEKTLGIKTLSSNERLLKIFEKEAEETLQLKLNQTELKERVSGLILISSSQLDISLESIASKMNMHPRVLQKRLKQEGTSFAQILLEVRKKLCVYYLSRNIDLSTISLSLGYLDLSSFFRAFKKWYGMTPSQWREKKGGL